MTTPKWPYTGSKPIGPSRKWQARIVATEEALREAAPDALIQADFTFMAPSLGVATGVVQWTMSVLRVSEAMRIEYIRLWQGDRGTPRRVDEEAPLEQIVRPRVKPRDDTVTIQNDAGRFVFTEGHEYQIQTMIPGLERRPRYSRMSFLGSGPGADLQFNARGPDRTHDGQYGGTQTVSPRSIVASVEVEHDVAKRYCFLTKQQFIKLRDQS